ncbi:MAG: hypothetical protein AAF694_28385 [Bacteroidota bacterium]
MKLLIPYSRKKNLDYYVHKQYNRFLHVLGVGIQRVAEEHARTIAEANLKAGREIRHSLDKGFQQVEASQRAIESTLIQQNDILETGFNNLEIRLYKGFEQNAKGLNEVANRVDNLGQVIIESGDKLFLGLSGVKASVDMGMMSLLSQFELQRKEMKQGFELLADLLENSQKTQARERYKDGLHSFETYLKHPDEPQFLTDARAYFLKSIEGFRGNPFAHLYLGHIYEEAALYYDLEKAQEHYMLCATYAKGMENNGLACVGYFMASWMAYVRGEIDAALSLGKNAIQMDADRIPEVYYNMAKFHAYAGQAEPAMQYLATAIDRFDPLYSLKADQDQDFQGIREELSSFFTQLRDRAAKRWEEKLGTFGLTSGRE